MVQGSGFRVQGWGGDHHHPCSTGPAPPSRCFLALPRRFFLGACFADDRHASAPPAAGAS